MARRAHVVNWNGRDVPTELRDLPAGKYVVEAVEEEVALTEEQDRGLELALASYRRGDIVESSRVRDLVDAALKRRGSSTQEKRSRT